MGGWGGVEWDAGNVHGGAGNRALSGLAVSRSSLRVPGAFMDGQRYKVLLFFQYHENGTKTCFHNTPDFRCSHDVEVAVLPWTVGTSPSASHCIGAQPWINDDRPSPAKKRSDSMSLADALRAALPADSNETLATVSVTPGFKGTLRYIHTPAKPCEPLFSPPPGHEPEKTRSSSHFLTLSVHPLQTAEPQAQGKVDAPLADDAAGVLGIGVEIHVYTTKHLTTIFVSKADTTGYMPSRPPSRTKIICTTFIQWLLARERSKHPHRRIVVSLFARAQAQYLFPGSAEHRGKHVLDDRQLIRWWARVLDPLLDHDSDGADRPDITAHLTIPGHDATELRHYFPRITSASSRRWHAGTPLKDLAAARGVPAGAPPRSLLPRFPDDPKARFMQDLDDEAGLAEPAGVSVSPARRKSGRWKNVRDLDRFWEAMEFRQECASGRVVGFIWVVVSPKAAETDGGGEGGRKKRGGEAIQATENGSQEQRDGTPTPAATATATAASHTGPPKRRERRRTPLTGPIVPRQPRRKGGAASLTAATATATAIATSSSSSSSDLTSVLSHAAQDGALLLSKDGYDKAIQTLLNLDFVHLSVAARSTRKWVQEVGGLGGGSGGEWGVEVVGRRQVIPAPAVGRREGVMDPTARGNEEGRVNDLGGMVRRKRKVEDGAEGGQGQAGRDAVTVLAAGTVRKKPKAAS